MRIKIESLDKDLMKPKNNLIPVSGGVEEKVKWLKKKCYYNRRNSLSCVKWGGSGHMGGALSCAEILGVLYFWVAQNDPKNPIWDGRDRIVLSKGHASPMIYATLASAGYFPEEELRTFRQLNTRLQGHPEYGTPGIEVPSGSLGQGFSAALGIATAIKYLGRKERVYAIIGDGELQEGQCWEVIMFAAANGIDNFTAILDYNGVQQDDFIENTLSIDPVSEKFEAFGWETISLNGNSVEELIAGFTHANSVKGKPSVIIAKTQKGHGVSYMENQPKWHGTSPPNDELFKQAIEELKATEENI